MSSKYDISVYNNESLDFTLTVERAGEARNLSGYTAEFMLKNNVDEADALYDFSDSVTVTEAEGLLTIAVGADEIVACDVGKYVYDIRIVSSTSAEVLLNGYLEILNGVSFTPEVTPPS